MTINKDDYLFLCLLAILDLLFMIYLFSLCQIFQFFLIQLSHSFPLNLEVLRAGLHYIVSSTWALSNSPGLFKEIFKFQKNLIGFKSTKQGFPGGSVVKNIPANAGDRGLIPGPGRSHIHWTTQPVSCNYWAHAPQLLNVHLEPMICNQRNHCNEKPPLTTTGDVINCYMHFKALFVF